MKSITVKELKTKEDNNEDFQLIDVREEYEFEIANLGAELIPMNEVLANHDKIAKDKPVIIHCRSGKRSASVIDALEKQFGFDNLYNLEGGILAYSDEIDPSIPKY